jgi:hypothetical protein
VVVVLLKSFAYHPLTSRTFPGCLSGRDLLQNSSG